MDFETLRVGGPNFRQPSISSGLPHSCASCKTGRAWSGAGSGFELGRAVSVPIGDDSGSVSYEDTSAQVKGLLLLFDRDWILTSAREGNL